MFSVLVIRFFTSRRRHTSFDCDWSSDVCSSDLLGHSVSDETVRRRLADMGYSLQANVKNLEESAAGRDRQFRYINRQVKQFLARQEPVLSVDTKKKERVGNFKNAGKAWRPKGQPMEVNGYDFPHLEVGPAIPYGAYDQQR